MICLKPGFYLFLHALNYYGPIVSTDRIAVS